MKWIPSVIILIIVICNANGKAIKGKCTKSPLKIDKQGGTEKVQYCQYSEGPDSLAVDIFPGSEFMTKDCTVCKCTVAGLECCENIVPSSSSIPAGCKVIRNGCDVFIVRMDDTGKDCITGEPVQMKVAGQGNKVSVKHLLNSPETFAMISLAKTLYSKMNTVPNAKPTSSMMQVQNRTRFLNNDGEPTFMDFLNWHNQRNGGFQNRMMGNINPWGMNRRNAVIRPWSIRNGMANQWMMGGGNGMIPAWNTRTSFGGSMLNRAMSSNHAVPTGILMSGGSGMTTAGVSPDTSVTILKNLRDMLGKLKSKDNPDVVRDKHTMSTGALVSSGFEIPTARTSVDTSASAIKTLRDILVKLKGQVSPPNQITGQSSQKTQGANISNLLQKLNLLRNSNIGSSLNWGGLTSSGITPDSMLLNSLTFGGGGATNTLMMNSLMNSNAMNMNSLASGGGMTNPLLMDSLTELGLV